MPIWEYKVITSGKGGFATPALLEKYLNDLGREEWEILEFHSQPDNFLAFSGLARRPTQRDWTLEDAAAAAAKAEADKLRAEFEAKFKAGTSSAPAAAAGESTSFIEEKLESDDGFRKPVDTSRDADADEEDKEEDDWDKLTAAEEDELPNFFEAIKPHMRRNQRGPGMSVGVDYLAKKWGQTEDDLKGALVECGFSVPDDEDAKPEYLEFEGDLYWVNVNRRGELWINTKEKPRPVFRAVKGQKVVTEDEPKPERVGRHEKGAAKSEATEAASAPAEAAGGTKDGGPEAAKPEAPAEPVALPAGGDLLRKIRPHMRRNRRGPGASGSVNFLSRALKCRDADLVEGFKALGLIVPASPSEKATNVEIGNEIWWVNLDSRGGIWINGRDKKHGEVIAVSTPDSGPTAESSPVGSPAAGVPEPGAASEPRGDIAAAGQESSPARESGETGSPRIGLEPVPASVIESSGAAQEGAEGSGGPARESRDVASAGSASILASVRPLLKETKTGATAAKIDRVAEGLAKPVEEAIVQLTAAGLVVPEKPREKPVFVEHAGEIFWFNRNARGELWLNAKASKYADERPESSEGEAAEPASAGGADSDATEKKSRRPRTRKKTE